MAGIVQDINERKRAEGRFQVLTTLSPATIWFGDPDGGVEDLGSDEMGGALDED